jgi:hypothetical protein
MKARKNDPTLDRRTFVRGSFLALLGGATVTIVGCAGTSPTAPSVPSAAPPPRDVPGTVATNHGHSAMITAANMSAGGGLSLSIRGTASHDHMVELSAAELEQIRNFQVVEKRSTGTGHTHMVVFNDPNAAS